jgi:hypothetical protein
MLERWLEGGHRTWRVGYHKLQSRPYRQLLYEDEDFSAHGSNLALTSPVQCFDILLNPLLVDIWVLIPLTTQCHVEHSTCQLGLY